MPPAAAVFEIECGKGTYVRSLARDMGRDLGCFGHIAELRRVEVEPFTRTISSRSTSWRRRCLPADAGEPAEGDRFAAIDAYIVETAAALDCLPQIAVTDDAASRIRLGNAVIVRGRDAPVEAAEACATARGGWWRSARSRPACSSRSGFLQADENCV